MEHTSAMQTAEQELRNHGLTDWTVETDASLTRLGVCRHRSKQISLSRVFIARATDAEVRDTILHEIAHALAGHAAGHGPEWKRVCVQIGARPVRCGQEFVDRKTEAPYVLRCGGCGAEWFRHRPKMGHHGAKHRCGGTLTLTYRG